VMLLPAGDFNGSICALSYLRCTYTVGSSTRGHPACKSICAIYPEGSKMLYKKGKVFPYSLPSVGPRADPGVQAVSPQVT